ncbi:MAG: hypothetical protein F7C35_06555 [Desulfurococcales archaeon]|nr:hypothetical protein [Desulfurococcales archaeon]
MSILGERESLASKEELIEYLKRRIEELKSELRILATILAMLEPASVEEPIDPSERVEDVKVSRRVIAKLGQGEDYVRLVPKFPTVLPVDIKSYIESVVEEIAERQAKDGVAPEERARLKVKEGPDGILREARIVNLYTPLEKVKAKAALRYAGELLYQIYRKKDKGD